MTIVIVNIVLGMIIKALADFENFSTATRYNISVATKNAVA